MSAVKALSETIEHLARRDDDAAVEALLAAWAIVGAPEIADLLDYALLRVCRHVDWVAPHARKYGHGLAYYWPEIAAEQHPADLDELLATLIDRSDMVARLRALFGFRSDPRLCRVVTLFTTTNAFLGDDAFTLAGDVLEHAGDPRILPILATSVEPTTGYEPTRLLYWAKTTHERLEKAFASRRTSLTTDEQRLVVSLSEHHLADVIGIEQERKRWLDRIAEDPKDLGSRQVFADWLEEHNDPAGPYISRALNDDLEAAPPVVLDTRQWLGPLEHAVKVFTRKNGFPHQCIAQSSLAPTLGALAWATVAELTLGNVRDDESVLADLILHPVMKSLRIVSLKARLAELIVKRAFATASSALGNKNEPETRAARETLSRLMLIITDEIPPGFLASLEELHLDGIGGPVAPEDVAVALSLRVRRLELVLKMPVEYKLVLERDERGLWAKVELEFREYANYAMMLDTFRGIPEASLTSVLVRMPPRNTGYVEARPLPLKQTHGPSLAARFPHAKTEIRSS